MEKVNATIRIERQAEGYTAKTLFGEHYHPAYTHLYITHTYRLEKGSPIFFSVQYNYRRDETGKVERYADFDVWLDERYIEKFVKGGGCEVDWEYRYIPEMYYFPSYIGVLYNQREYLHMNDYCEAWWKAELVRDFMELCANKINAYVLNLLAERKMRYFNNFML